MRLNSYLLRATAIFYVQQNLNLVTKMVRTPDRWLCRVKVMVNVVTFYHKFVQTESTLVVVNIYCVGIHSGTKQQPTHQKIKRFGIS